MSSVSFADNNYTMDGHFWVQMSAFNKGIYLSGFRNASEYVADGFAPPLQLEAMERSIQYQKKNNGGRDLIKTLEGLQDEKKRSWEKYYKYKISNVSEDIYITTIDALYKRVENRVIELPEAIYIAKKIIAGESKDTIDDIILYFTDYLAYSIKEEKKGNAGFAIFGPSRPKLP